MAPFKVPAEVKFVLAPATVFGLSLLSAMVYNALANDPDTRSQTFDVYAESPEQAAKMADGYHNSAAKRMFDARVHSRQTSMFNNETHVRN